MAPPFDPYHKWLGIPPEAQPPDRYRLLGIQRFESDPDVISHAVDRQMAHVRTFQTGQHSAESQKLLNELAAARLCLLHPEKKAAYDASLRAQAPPQPAPAVPPAQPSQPPPPVVPTLLPEPALPVAQPIVAQPIVAAARRETATATTLPASDVLPSATLTPGYALRRRRQFPTVAVLLTLAAMTLVALAAVLVRNQSASRVARSDQPDAVDAAPAQPGKASSQSPAKASPEPTEVQPAETLPNANGPQSPENPPPDEPAKPGPNNPSPPAPQPPKPNPVPGAEPDVAAPPKSPPGSKSPAEAAVEAAVGPIAPPPKEIAPAAGGPNVDAPPAAPAPGPMVSVTLPSGKTLDPSLFEISRTEIDTLASRTSSQAGANQRGVAPVYVGTQENGSVTAIAAQKGGKLSGVAVRFHENGNPKILANYVNANRQGVVRMWDESGKNLFWGQFAAGLKDGLIIVFDQDRPWYVREAARGDIKASYLVSYAGAAPSIITLGAADPSPKESAELKRAVDLGSRIEEQLLTGENETKRELRSWYLDEVEEARRKTVADQAPAKRAAMVKRIAARQAAQNAALKALHGKAMRGGR